MFKGFISYTRKDQELVDALREGIIEQFAISGLDCELWDDNQIPLGSEWNTAISKKLREVDFALLFVSNGFLSNKFIVEEEIQVFLERKAEEETFVIIPIAIKPCRFDSFAPLSKYQFFIPDGVKVRLPQEKNVTFSHVYNMGSPWVDHYLQLLFDEVHLAILPHVNLKKDLAEEKIVTQNDELYTWLKNNKTYILDNSVQAIAIDHHVPVDSLQLMMEAKWLFDCIFAKVVTDSFNALKDYLSEEKYFESKIYTDLLNHFENQIHSNLLLPPESKKIALTILSETEKIMKNDV